MKIIDAYYDLDIRRGVKKYLLAQGLAIKKVDDTYRRFGVYLTRLKSVNYDRSLQSTSSLSSFLSDLKVIFEEKWVNNMNYEEMPSFYYWYTDYLQTIVAIDPTISIEGITPCLSNQPLEQLTSFETPYLKQGKLKIIANPELIIRVAPILKGEAGSLVDAINIAKDFYGDLLPNMTDSDWGNVLMQIWVKSTKKKKGATNRNIEILFPDGTSRVFSGNDAMFEVATMIGVQKLIRLKNIKHRGSELVTRVVSPTNALAYKEFENGWFLNLMGGNEEKLKTLRVLNSICSLNLKINITTAEPTSERKVSIKLIFD